PLRSTFRVLLSLSTTIVSLLSFHETAPTQIYILSLHDALPISAASAPAVRPARSGPPWRRYRTAAPWCTGGAPSPPAPAPGQGRSEERRVGKEGKGRWGPADTKIKEG